MATEELLATADTAAQSADVVVADGAAATVFLKDASGNDVPQEAQVHIEAKTAAGGYFRIGTLSWNTPGRIVFGPVTFRVSRPAGYSIGVEKG